VKHVEVTGGFVKYAELTQNKKNI